MKYNKEWNILEIEAFKIEGECPVFQQGEKMIIRGPTIDLQQSDSVCIHALFSLGFFIVALREGINPKKLSLDREEDGYAYFQCLVPGKDYTRGGTVLFRLRTPKDY